MAQEFTGGVRIAGGQGDFLAPSEDCVKPIEVLNRKKKRKLLQQQESTADQPVAITVDDDGLYFETLTDGKKEQLEAAQITLNDCLACSGCVTSAETVLITQQSKEEFFTTVAEQPHRLVVVTVAPQVRASLATHFNVGLEEAMRQLRRLLLSFGAAAVLDSSFGRELSLLEACHEFVERFRARQAANSSDQGTGDQESGGTALAGAVAKRGGRRGKAVARHTGGGPAMPLLASSCPGWICYAEKTQGDMLPHISAVKSPQQVMGSLVKEHLAGMVGMTADEVYHVALMPCYDKKLEASRDDFYNEILRTRDVDTVLTASEILDMIQEKDIDFLAIPDALPAVESSSPEQCIATTATAKCQAARRALLAMGERLYMNVTPEGQFFGPYGGSGGWAESVLRFAAQELFGMENPLIHSKTRPRNQDLTELWVERPTEAGTETVLRFAVANGFRNIQNVVRQIKRGKCSFDYVEIMACPSGCLNGGGQIKATGDERAKELLQRVEQKYLEAYVVQPFPPVQPAVTGLYEEWLGGRSSQKARAALYTVYHKVPQLESLTAAIKW